jgi:hypothetical protein
MAGRQKRATPLGFRKTSYEFTEAAKALLVDLTIALDRDGYPGVSETAVLEALVTTAKRTGVDRAILDRVLRQRRAAQERAANLI